ncbi:hypothetical protein PENTCL1PPCAC_12425, partial [Pristionchus entomophagus]
NEEFDRGLSTIERSGLMYAYRICDDPTREGVLIVSDDTHLDRLTMKRIHRSKIIYGSQKAEATDISAHRLGDNAIMIEAPDYRILKSFAPSNSCPFIYFAFGSNLHALNTDTMVFLPVLRVDGIDYVSDIAGVHDEMITLNCHRLGQFYLMNAQLPCGYFQTSMH